MRVAIYLVLPAGLKKLKPKEERRFLLLAFLLAFAFAFAALLLLSFLLLAKPDSGGATGCYIATLHCKKKGVIRSY